jgi:hypothetical protein
MAIVIVGVYLLTLAVILWIGVVESAVGVAVTALVAAIGTAVIWGVVRFFRR